MIVDFHGMKCRYGTYRVMGETKPILTLVDEALDWKKSLQYDFTEPQNGFWCHFLTEDEIKNFLPKEKADELLNEMHEKEVVSQDTDDLTEYHPKKITVRFIIEILLVIAAVAVAVNNFFAGRTITYMASIVAVCGTIAILVRDIYKSK